MLDLFCLSKHPPLALTTAPSAVQAALELVLRQLSAAQVRWGGPAPCWRA